MLLDKWYRDTASEEDPPLFNVWILYTPDSEQSQRGEPAMTGSRQATADVQAATAAVRAGAHTPTLSLSLSLNHSLIHSLFLSQTHTANSICSKSNK